MNPYLRYLFAAPLAIAAPLVGCREAAEEASAPARRIATEPVRPFEEVPATSEAILAWLNSERYRETWELLPGTFPMREGSEGHGALLTTYADPLAIGALERAALSMPPGAAIALEDYLPDSTLSTVSVMVWFPDSDGRSGEWRFARFGPAGEIEAGSMDSCRSCHVLEPDLVFGWELGTPLPIDSTGAAAGPTSAP